MGFSHSLLSGGSGIRACSRVCAWGAAPREAEGWEGGWKDEHTLCKAFSAFAGAEFALGLGVRKELCAERAVGNAVPFREFGLVLQGNVSLLPGLERVSTVGFAPWLWTGGLLWASVSPSVNGTEQLQEVFAMELLGKEEAVLKHGARNEDSSKGFMGFSFLEARKACSLCPGYPNNPSYFPWLKGSLRFHTASQAASSAFSSPSISSSPVISSLCIFPFPSFWSISPEILVNLVLRILFSLIVSLCLELPLSLLTI